MKYNDWFSVQTDLLIYMNIRNNTKLTLNLLYDIVVLRYTWLQQNWSKFYTKLQQIYTANDSILLQLNRDITSNNNIFLDIQNFIKYRDYLSNISEADLILTNNEKIIINNEKQRVLSLTLKDFENMKNYITDQTVLLSYKIGLGATDTETQNLRNVTYQPKIKNPDITDLDTINNLIILEQLIDSIIIEFKNKREITPNLLQIGNNNIDASSTVRINNLYKSYILVPFQASLENMALKYLGSSERIFELVSVNDLKPPYYDNIGTTIYLQNNLVNQTITIDNTLKNEIYLGAKIKLGSNTVREYFDVVENIQELNSSLIIKVTKQISLSTRHRAFVKIYKANTLKENDYVKIPIANISNYLNIPSPESVEFRQLDKALLSFGIDIGKDENTNDILINSSNDISLIAGIDNIRQAILNILKTNTNELEWHPMYGIPNFIGDYYYNNISESSLLADTIIANIKKDKRFVNVLVRNIENNNTAIKIDLLVLIQNASEYLPLSFISQ